MKKVFIVIFSLIIQLFTISYCYAGDTGSFTPAEPGCVDIEFIFARGSGAEYMNSDMWYEYQRQMEILSSKKNYSYRITDVDYPAVAVDSPLSNALGAYISAGKYYEFGKSVNAGVKWLRAYYANMARDCPDTRWVLTGYSQGAMVATEAVKSFLFEKVVYLALFADPQLDLPEGKGLFPDACSGRNMSEYRIYVPVCRTYEGSLKARNPYQYGELTGKYGLWCGANDFVCGSSKIPWDTSGHTQYVGKIKQLRSILSKRLEGKARTTRTVSRTDEENEIVAHLSLETYYARPGEEVTFDASGSFSLAGDIIDYRWSIDDGFVENGDGPILSHTFSNEGNYVASLTVRDEYENEASCRANIVISNDDLSNNKVAILPEIKQSIVDGNIAVNWDDYPAGIKYLIVRLDGFVLGYIDISRGNVTITDIAEEDYNLLEFAWMDDSFEIIEATDVVGDDISSPNTGVSFANGMVPSFTVALCGLLIRKILK